MLRVIAFQETKFFFNPKVLSHTRYAVWMSIDEKKSDSGAWTKHVTD